MMIPLMMAVRRSDTGMEYSTPSSPKKTGSKNANPTPKTISRIIDSRVEDTALPEQSAYHGAAAVADTDRYGAGDARNTHCHRGQSVLIRPSAEDQGG